MMRKIKEPRKSEEWAASKRVAFRFLSVAAIRLVQDIFLLPPFAGFLFTNRDTVLFDLRLAKSSRRPNLDVLRNQRQLLATFWALAIVIHLDDLIRRLQILTLIKDRATLFA